MNAKRDVIVRENGDRQTGRQADKSLSCSHLDNSHYEANIIIITVKSARAELSKRRRIYLYSEINCCFLLISPLQ